MSHPFYRLCAEDLLSKWGFGDGDLFFDLLYDWRDANLPEGNAPGQQLLKAAVRKWLIPALDQSVELIEIVSIHNPIRAAAVDGVPVTEHWSGEALLPLTLLTPEFVDITEDQVRDLARELVSPT